MENVLAVADSVMPTDVTGHLKSSLRRTALACAMTTSGRIRNRLPLGQCEVFLQSQVRSEPTAENSIRFVP